MKKLFLGVVLAAPLWAACASVQAKELSCHLNFEMSGWSAIYKKTSGTGVVHCSDGKTLPVRIETRGGGLTFGKTKIDNGRGQFSKVHSIDDVIGGYAAAEASAGAVKAAKAQVVTKGSISLALSGTGTGWDLGVSFGSFIITKR